MLKNSSHALTWVIGSVFDIDAGFEIQRAAVSEHGWSFVIHRPIVDGRIVPDCEISGDDAEICVEFKSLVCGRRPVRAGFILTDSPDDLLWAMHAVLPNVIQPSRFAWLKEAEEEQDFQEVPDLEPESEVEFEAEPETSAGSQLGALIRARVHQA